MVLCEANVWQEQFAKIQCILRETLVEEVVLLV